MPYREKKQPMSRVNVSLIRGCALVVLSTVWATPTDLSAANTPPPAQLEERRIPLRQKGSHSWETQIQQKVQSRDYSISVESNLVALDVLVTDEDGNVLGGLKKENFRVLDNGKPQIITQFEPTDDPITIVILMEYSGLAYDYFAYKAAYRGSAFLDHLDSGDWVALITYDMRSTIQVDFTHSKVELRDALSTLSYPSFSEANLFDAIAYTLGKLEHVKGKKSILLITTGIDTFSQNTLDQTMQELRQNDVTIFCIGVAESEFMAAEIRGGGTSMSYLQAKNQLDTFAGLTAGVAYFPRFEGEIPDIFRSVVGFLRNEYEIGFSPEETSLDGEYHKLKVEIIAPDGRPLKVINKEGKTRKVVVFAREDYTATKGGTNE